MSKYKLERFPQDKFWFQIYDNVNRLSWQQIKAMTGCHALLNLVYFNLSTFAVDDTCMVDGKWLYKARWSYNGLLADKDGKLTVGPDSAATWGYANAEPCYLLNGVDQQSGHFSANGSTFVGMEADGTVVPLLASKDTPITSKEGVAALAGCRDILRFDGSWSSQGSLGPGLDVDPSQERIVRIYLLIFKRDDDKKEDKPVSNYKVTADIGLNIRKEANSSAAKVGAYAYGALVSVLEVKGGWGRTDKGWVSMAYLEAVTPTVRVTDNGITIQQRIIPSAANNRPGYANARTHITIHETGNKAKGADATAHAAYLDSAAGEKDLVSWHYTADDHAIVQHLPDTESAYHAGDGAKGPGNTNSISIEICVNEGGDFEAAKRNAAALVRLLMQEHKIPLDKVVQHNHWNGKDCPYTIRHTAGAWEAFLALCEGKSTQLAEDYREAVKARFGLADETVAYLAAYQYGPDLLRKLATQG